MGIKIKFNSVDYEIDDVERIVQVFAGQGIAISQGDAFTLWSIYSHEMRANWVTLPSEDAVLFKKLSPYWE